MNTQAAPAAADDEGEEKLEAWTPQEFDHFTDLGLLRPGLHAADDA